MDFIKNKRISLQINGFHQKSTDFIKKQESCMLALGQTCGNPGNLISPMKNH